MVATASLKAAALSTLRDEWTIPDPEELPGHEEAPLEAPVVRTPHDRSPREEELERRRWLYAFTLIAMAALVFGVLSVLDRFDFRAAFSPGP